MGTNSGVRLHPKLVPKSARPHQRADDCSPGPGTYDLTPRGNNQIFRPSPQFMSKAPRDVYSQKARDKSPGPGHYDYNHPSSLQYQKGFSISGRPASRHRKSDRSSSPGPGHYEEVSAAVRPKVTQAVIGPPSPNITHKKNQNPGPGHYPSHSDIGHKQPHWFTIGQKLPKPKDPENPGPGAYSPQMVGPAVPSAKIMQLSHREQVMGQRA